MKRIMYFFLVCVFIISIASCKGRDTIIQDYSVKPVPFTDVDINDDFWAPKIEVNRTVSIQHCLAMHEETGRLASPKYVEAAAYMLVKREDPELEAYMDELIDKMVDRLERRISENPEAAVHVSGHFLEAAIAYYSATGKRKMLDAAIKAADTMDEIYGPGKKTYISGHEGLKIGLIQLYRHTGNDKYWKLAKFFLDERGKGDYDRTGEYAVDRTYAQDHKPVIEQEEAVGHAVRATFLYIALTDIAALTGDPAYSEANRKIWEDAVFKKTYLTGGIGSVRFHEQFGDAYELPNVSAWNETCAAYGSAVWNHRLFLRHKDAKYIDMMERVLYNGWLVGVSYKGNRFFYQNPLKCFGNYERFRWINVPCCPPNVVRLMASLGSYIYAKSGNDIYVNLFIGNNAAIQTENNLVQLTQETQYPWTGTVKLMVEPEQSKEFSLLIRIPMWTQNQPMPGDLYHYSENYPDRVVITVNGEETAYETESGYARLKRKWEKGDVIEMNIPMPIRKVFPNRKIKYDTGLTALERGPLVYCAEWPDNKGGHVMNLLLHEDAVFEPKFKEDVLGGMTVINGDVEALHRENGGNAVESVKQRLTAIPYYAWANRGMGEMAVWMPRREDQVRVFPVVPPDPIKSVDSSGGIEKGWTGYHDQNDDITAVYDGFDPINSADESDLYFRMRPPLETAAWVEYTFNKPTEISSTQVYWVDDRRFCRLPESWRILYKENGRWIPVENKESYSVEKDKFNTVHFQPVTTTAVRIEVEPQNILYEAGMIGPPAAMFIDEDVTWREFGIIEWRIK